jgi:hypothetical protein
MMKNQMPKLVRHTESKAVAGAVGGYDNYWTPLRPHRERFSTFEGSRQTEDDYASLLCGVDNVLDWRVQT